MEKEDISNIVVSQAALKYMYIMLNTCFIPHVHKLLYHLVQVMKQHIKEGEKYILKPLMLKMYIYILPTMFYLLKCHNLDILLLKTT